MPRDIAAFFAAASLFAALAGPLHAEKNLVRPAGTTRYAPMIARLKADLAYDGAQGQNRMQLTSIGRSVRGRELWMVTLHDAAPALPAQDAAQPNDDVDSGSPPPPAPPATPKKVFYLCRQHGHEPASTEGALQFIDELVHAAPGSPLDQDLRRTTVYIVPMANPDGAEAYLRHNAHDKDINRDWIKRTQPETQALAHEIAKLHPDLMTDQHELYPNDTRPDFTEAAGPGSGAAPTVIAACTDTQDVVQAWMEGLGMHTVVHQVTDHHPARLAHRYGGIVAGVPAILFETNRLTGSGRSVAMRGQAHERFMVAILRDVAGERTQLLTEASQNMRGRLELASRRKPFQRAGAAPAPAGQPGASLPAAPGTGPANPSAPSAADGESGTSD